MADAQGTYIVIAPDSIRLVTVDEVHEPIGADNMQLFADFEGKTLEDYGEYDMKYKSLTKEVKQSTIYATKSGREALVYAAAKFNRYTSPRVVTESELDTLIAAALETVQTYKRWVEFLDTAVTQ